MGRSMVAANGRFGTKGWRAMVGMLLLCGLAAGGGVQGQPLPPPPPPAPLPPPPPPPPLPQAPGGKSSGAVVPVAELLIDLSEQRLSAFDGEHRLLYRRPVSTGLPSSPTPSGAFTVASRFVSTALTGRDYRIPAVPNVLCLGGGGLNPDSICIHPAPWQEAAGEPFGVRRSHGCVRTSSATARWLFERTAVGTPVIIRP
jgi:lipoprotein-anchoring transpeptidase ErfK/SrfK